MTLYFNQKMFLHKGEGDIAPGGGAFTSNAHPGCTIVFYIIFCKCVVTMQKQPDCIKRCNFQKAWVKICEIKCGNHEMATMM